MYKKNKCYWMYSKYAIENDLLNPERNILEMLVEEKFSNFYKTFLKAHNIKKNIKINTVSKQNILPR